LIGLFMMKMLLYIATALQDRIIKQYVIIHIISQDNI
jgi:hypothetical protein